MSLAAMLETHDEAALSALASVGVVRRASRDLAAGKAQVLMRDESTATVAADGQDVTLDGSGPGCASCGCPATGICRHVVLAILALREALPATEAEYIEPQAHAREDILTLTEDDLRKFAGADWDKAVRQARISSEATVTEDGTNLSVRLPDTDKPVILLSGQGLTGAVFKGPKTTKRRVVTAAALVVRMKHGGQTLDGLTAEAEAPDSLTTEALEAMREAVIDLAGAVLGGGSAIAEERVFDLAISARAQAAPRLTALLRALVRQAHQARKHHFMYDDARFLSEAATTCALTYALQSDPMLPALTGVLRRNYTEREDLDLTLAGAVRWSAPSGARGTRLHAVDPHSGIWYMTGQARAAGMDPSFSPRSVYHAPLWGLATVDGLVGRSITVKSPRISSDNQIAWSDARAALNEGDFIEVLSDTKVLHVEWAAAREDIAKRMPGGLAWTGNTVPVLIAPQRIDDIRFDDIAQLYHLTARDAVGRPLQLTVPADQAEDVDWLHSNYSALNAVLCEATVAELSLRLTPVTAYVRREGDLKCINLTLDPVTERIGGGASAIGGRIQSFFKRTFTASAEEVATGPLQAICHRSFDAVAEALRFGHTAAANPIIAEAETVGLTTLANSLKRFDTSRSVEDGLRASYVAGEILKRIW